MGNVENAPSRIRLVNELKQFLNLPNLIGQPHLHGQQDAKTAKFVLIDSVEKFKVVSRDERSTFTGRYTQGRVRPDIGWEAPAVGCQRPAFRWLGDLSFERFAS